MAFSDDKELMALIDAAVDDPPTALVMLNAKADLIRRRNRLEETALHFLAVENFPEGVAFLCRHGAEVDSVDFSKATPLLHAAALGYEEVVRVLLAHGANPNVEDNTGETVLSTARRTGNERIVQMLIQAGARAEPGGFERMTKKPRMAKAHSKQVADEYVRLGWTLCSESRVPGHDEPAEYYFEWQRADEPVLIDWTEFHHKHESA